MLSAQHHMLLKKLEELLRLGTLTPTDRVETGTFLCLTHDTPFGQAYTQVAFDSMPPELASGLKGAKKGDMIGLIRVIAVYDIWPSVENREIPPVKVFDN